MKTRAVLVLLLITACAALAFQLHVSPSQTAPTSLTAYIPQDALLTIESPDLQSLLHRWTSSAEGQAWLTSDNHGVFQNSRLFGRLSDAQTSFAKAAGIPAGADLLNQVAGKESVFAWYDITRLEFLYISLIRASQVDQSQLFQARGSFERRHAGNNDFYIRSSGASYSTVAFARVPTPSGELVLLATREDLIADALKLIAFSHPGQSIQQEPWFHDVSAALPAEKPAPALHMVLNLDRIAVDPHFRSYWIQRNITWTRQFRSAASDLYLESTRFREERVLLPKLLQHEPATPTDLAPDLASLAALAPPSTGVFRAVATSNPADAVTAIQEKLLGTYAAPQPNPEYAPEVAADPSLTGSANDLETRIDISSPVSPSASNDRLNKLFQSAGLDALLTLSSAHDPAERDGLWVPIHSAVVLHTASPQSPEALSSALQQALSGSLTAADIGVSFNRRDTDGVPVYSLTGLRPLFFAISSRPATGNLVLLSDDQALLSDLLHNLDTAAPSQPGSPATLIAAFNHSSQQRPYIRLTSLIDGTNGQRQSSKNSTALQPSQQDAEYAAPSFFSTNMRSLSDTFANLERERVVERITDLNLRQTVTYDWKAP